MTNEQVETIWEKILNNIKNNVGPSIFNIWFTHFQPRNFHQGTFKNRGPKQSLLKNWLEKKFSQVILKSIKEVVPEVKNLELVVLNKNLQSDEKQTVKNPISKKLVF